MRQFFEGDALVRIVALLLLMIWSLWAEHRVDNNMTREDQNSIKASELLNSLESYDHATTTGTLHSDNNVTLKDNNTEFIGATTKLDDVTTLDIAKEQRKQRKMAHKKKSNQDKKIEALIDTIVVKGSVLQGRINVLTSEYLSFELIYGEGSIRIDYNDVESLQTEHEYHIYFDGKETKGYITGIKEHAFLKIQHGQVEELITISKIDRFIISEDEDSSFENRMRNTFPYFSGNLDVGIEYETQKSYNKRKLKIAGHIERKRTIYTSIFDVTYSYEETIAGDTPKLLNKHELYSFLEQDIDSDDGNLFFIEMGYDFDVPRYVNHRLYPSAGYGYRIERGKKRWVQFKVGAGFVYENFLGDPDSATSSSKNQYAAGLFGVDAAYELGDLAFLNRIIFGAHLFYMPGARDLKSNWLLRYAVSADIPLSKTLSFKAVGRTVTDDNPSDSVGNNKTTFDLYLSLRF